MTPYEVLIPQLLAALVVGFVAVRVIRQTRRERAANRADFERRMADIRRQRAERLAAAAALDPPPVIRLTLDLGDGDDLPDLARIPLDARHLLDGLSRYEAAIGGRGLVLMETAARPGRVVLTLAPKDPADADGRMRRVADALNAAFDRASPAGDPAADLGPLPSGVVGAHAEVEPAFDLAF